MMVRINLLPGKKRGPGGNILWRIVAVMAVLLLAELGILYMAYSSKTAELKKRAKEVQDAQTQVQKVQKEIAALPDLEKQAVELEARERALAELTAVRMGPQHVLDELKRLLSRPKAKATIKAAKDAQWNVAWESDNVYLTTILEETPGAVRLEGQARGLDDIAELWLRLRSSKLFQQVRLANVTKGKADGLGDVSIEMDVLKFEFTANANFYYQTKEGMALMEQLGKSEEPAPATKATE